MPIDNLVEQLGQNLQDLVHSSAKLAIRLGGPMCEEINGQTGDKTQVVPSLAQRLHLLQVQVNELRDNLARAHEVLG